jgi:hypothetical protein
MVEEHRSTSRVAGAAMVLSPAASVAFVEAILNPTEPSETLMAAKQSYERIVNNFYWCIHCKRQVATTPRSYYRHHKKVHPNCKDIEP